jgi:serine protease AprX
MLTLPKEDLWMLITGYKGRTWVLALLVATVAAFAVGTGPASANPAPASERTPPGVTPPSQKPAPAPPEAPPTSPGAEQASPEVPPTSPDTTPVPAETVPAPADVAPAPAEAARTTTLQEITESIGARDFWRAGFTGKGVDIAVIDTGVADVPGMSGAGKLLHGVDVSFDAPFVDWAQRDGFGHGTHIAGIAAGRDAVASPQAYAADTTSFLGVAPDARIINVKAGDAVGGADVTQVIAAIDWVVEHRNDPGLNIRVINLAYGTDGLQHRDIDPLSDAVREAWRVGIVVVVSAGNSGGFVSQPGDSVGMTNPARHPVALAVGAFDTMGTANKTDDVVAGFSSPGDGQRNERRNPDIVAPGRSVASLRVPLSFADENYAATARVGDRLFRGSGTSQSAAVVSGAAALILQQRPHATPDQVKALLRNTATRLTGFTEQYQGKGAIDLRKALVARTPSPTQARRSRSRGDGSLDGSRGTFRLTLDGVTLEGDVDVFGAPLNTADLAFARHNGEAWVDSKWLGRDLAPSGATATSDYWSGRSWSSGSWSGLSWSGLSWSGRSWSDLGWDGRSWSGRSWSGRSWSGRSWSGRSWSWVDQAFAPARWE